MTQYKPAALFSRLYLVAKPFIWRKMKDVYSITSNVSDSRMCSHVYPIDII